MRNAVGHGIITFHAMGWKELTRASHEIFIEFAGRPHSDSSIDWQILIEGPKLRTLMFDLILRGIAS